MVHVIHRALTIARADVYGREVLGYIQALQGVINTWQCIDVFACDLIQVLVIEAKMSAPILLLNKGNW